MISFFPSDAILLRLHGGLGNQLFQLGAAIVIAKKFKAKSILIDTSSLDKYKTKREFELSKVVNFEKSEFVIQLKNHPILRLRLPKFIPFSNNVFSLVSDHNFENLVSNNVKSSAILDGYFQNIAQNSFDSIINEVRALCSIDYFSDDSSSCVIHIRGGDFIDDGKANLAPDHYYQRAIEYMDQKFKIDRWLVVTDDITFAKKIMNSYGHSMEFLSRGLLEDFVTIASCSKRILSASTFAIWASAIGHNSKDGAVILPDYLTSDLKKNFRLMNEVKLQLP